LPFNTGDFPYAFRKVLGVIGETIRHSVDYLVNSPCPVPDGADAVTDKVGQGVGEYQSPLVKIDGDFHVLLLRASPARISGGKFHRSPASFMAIASR
jgi:hypothetical protein